jgi:hypothetical protein
MPLVERMEMEEIGDGTRGGVGPFILPSYGGRIVEQIVNDVRADVECLGQNIELSNGGCQLQVAVGDGAPPPGCRSRRVLRRPKLTRCDATQGAEAGHWEEAQSARRPIPFTRQCMLLGLKGLFS